LDWIGLDWTVVHKDVHDRRGLYVGLVAHYN